MTLQEREHCCCLRSIVCRRQHASAGLHQNLVSRVRLAVSAAKIRRLQCRAFTGGHVLQRDLQARGICLQRVFLESAQAALQLRNLLDGGADDLAGLLGVAADDRRVAAGGDIVEESNGVVSQRAGGDRTDSDADLLLAVDLTAELEKRRRRR